MPNSGLPFCGIWPNTLAGLFLSLFVFLSLSCFFFFFFFYDLCIWLCGVLIVAHRPLSPHAGPFTEACGLSLWCTGFVTPQYMGPRCPVRGHTHIPCIARWILNHRTSSKVPLSFFDKGASLWSGVLLIVLSYYLTHRFLIFQNDFDLSVATFHRPWLCGLRHTLLMWDGKINTFYVRYLNCSFF